MRVFKQKYTDRKGLTRESSKWYAEFVDHREIRRRLPGFTDSGATAELGRKVERLVEARSLHRPLDAELVRWLESMPTTMRARLAKWGILDSRAEHHGRPLSVHLADFHAAQLDKGNTQAHADLVKARAERVCDGCLFRFYSDVNASKVQRYLAGKRSGSKDEAGISHQTSNFYLQAIKQFCRWMVKDGRASESPVEHLTGLNVKLDRRHDRRSLTVEELTWLLRTTAAGPIRHKMDGKARAMLYRVGMETGFRRNELRSLTPSNIETASTPPAIIVEPQNVKNRQPVVQVIRPELAEELQTWIEDAQIAPESPLWPELTQHTSKMLKADLEAARDAWLDDSQSDAEREKREQSNFLCYEDDAGRYADFHALRHSFVSLITQGGVHPKLAQRLARHSTVELTLSRYSHTLMTDEAQALEVLPALPSMFDGPESERQKLRATGTEGAEAVLPNCLPNRDAKPCLSVHRDALSEGANPRPFEQQPEARTPCKTGDRPSLQGDSESGEGRFELPRPSRACRFSRPVHSATLPPLRSPSATGATESLPFQTPLDDTQDRIRLPSDTATTLADTLPVRAGCAGTLIMRGRRAEVYRAGRDSQASKQPPVNEAVGAEFASHQKKTPPEGGVSLFRSVSTRPMPSVPFSASDASGSRRGRRRPCRAARGWRVRGRQRFRMKLRRIRAIRCR